MPGKPPAQLGDVALKKQPLTCLLPVTTFRFYSSQQEASIDENILKTDLVDPPREPICVCVCACACVCMCVCFLFYFFISGSRVVSRRT